MSVTDIEQALSSVPEPTLVRTFVALWPTIEGILSSFSQATELPLFVFLNGKNVFSTPSTTMPVFCRLLLTSSHAHLCFADGFRRATGVEPETNGVQLCHAGMLNGKREIHLGELGALTITYGSRGSSSVEALTRRSHLLERIGKEDADLQSLLANSAIASPPSELIETHDQALMDSIVDILQRLLTATIDFRSQSINMAHELCNTILGLGLLAKTLELSILEARTEAELIASAKDIVDNSPELLAESQLGLYVVRNFLSHASEYQYNKAVKQRVAPVNLGRIIADMIDLHRRSASGRGIDISAEGLDDLPTHYSCNEMEIRRLLHNVLTNAVKYSYRSIPNTTRRLVKVYTRVPFDPGFREKRFAVILENYGLGMDPGEVTQVFLPGYRGKQAVLEVPIGSGIGLSEAQKIMRAHFGVIRLRSRLVHRNDNGQPTYVTRVELIFPFSQHHEAILPRLSK
jgi:signal transduction histidine kinase